MFQPCGRDKPNFKDMNDFLDSVKHRRKKFFLMRATFDKSRRQLDANAPLEYAMGVIRIPVFLDHRSMTTRIRSNSDAGA
jgi:hypothetical protein